VRIARRLGAVAVVTVAVAMLASTALAAHAHAARHSLPVAAIQSAVQVKGSTTNGVLSLGIDRDDIGTASINGIPIKPAFEIDGELDFQPLGNGKALFNGDIPVKADEVNPVIDALIHNGLVFQAEHQHFYDLNPVVWFIHLRGEGDPVALARKVHAVLKATSVSLPQEPPSNPTSPLNKDRLQKILHGYDAEVGADGVVTVYVNRRDPITLGGVKVRPEANIATNVSFEPLDASGTQTAAAPDFSMEGQEVDRVMRTMRGQGWDIGCLYNQETGERPQLFFSHQFKTGDPYQLAAEIRKGLNRMNVQ
jgi:hypothetical protein